MCLQEHFSSSLQTATITDVRKISTASNEYLRKCLASWADPIYIPPGCRTISLCSWTGFNAVRTPTSANGWLKASDLWKDCGTTADYDPPASERCYVGVDQPNPDFQYAHVSRARQRRQCSSTTSWATVSEQGEGGAKPKPTPAHVEFHKQAPKRVDTKSQLTACLETRTASEEKKIFVAMMGLAEMTC